MKTFLRQSIWNLVTEWIGLEEWKGAVQKDFQFFGLSYWVGVLFRETRKIVKEEDFNILSFYLFIYSVDIY